MKQSLDCPVCSAADWEAIGSRCYRRDALDKASGYVRKRMRVFFEVWHPGCESVEHRSLLCHRCGFVTYSPRPSAADLDRKYRFLGSIERDENIQNVTPERESLRAGRLQRKLAKYLSSSTSRVLDFGGGDGRLVAPLASATCQCFVLDYAPSAVPNVTRLGSTLDELKAGDKFDLIVCSHVVEHLADPLETLQRLKGHMVEGGVIYVEAPMEIWCKAPLHEEPVTHVNFFNVGSTRTLLQRAGLFPVDLRLEDYPHPLGHHTVVVSAVGRNAPGEIEVIQYTGYFETKRYLNPNLKTRIERALLSPRRIPQAVWSRLLRHTA